MPIDYPQVLERRTEGEGAWTNQETMLYALGVGMGADPMDENELAFVYERNLKALPSFASVIRSRPVTEEDLSSVAPRLAATPLKSFTDAQTDENFWIYRMRAQP